MLTLCQLHDVKLVHVGVQLCCLIAMSPKRSKSDPMALLFEVNGGREREVGRTDVVAGSHGR